MVDFAKYFLKFTQAESCGKCVPCRVGTGHLVSILESICAGKAELADLDRLERLAQVVKRSSLCALGGTAPNPVLSALKYFRDEFVEHIVDHRCRAVVCRDLVEYRNRAGQVHGLPALREGLPHRRYHRPTLGAPLPRPGEVQPSVAHATRSAASTPLPATQSASNRG
jgi:hypothetical protein